MKEVQARRLRCKAKTLCFSRNGAAFAAMLLLTSSAGIDAFGLISGPGGSGSRLRVRSSQGALERGQPPRGRYFGFCAGGGAWSGRDGSGGRMTPSSSLAAAGPAAAVAAATAAATTSAALAASPASGGGGGGIAASLSAAANSVASAGPVLGSLGVLAVVIALHEAGHLTAALSQGIKVRAFSIGFGPRLLSYRHGGEDRPGFLKGKFSGPSWDWGGVSEEGESGEEEEALSPRGKGSGGRRSKKAGKDIARVEPEEGVEYTLRAIPVGGFVSFPNNYEMDEEGVVTEYDDPDLLGNRGPGSRAVVIAAGVVVNFLLAWACIFGSVSTTGIVEPHYSPGVVLQEITDRRGGAASAGFRTEDVILSINGKTLEAGDNTSLEKAVQTIRASNGKPVAVEISRGGSKPIMRMVKTEIGSNGKYSIGVRLSPHLDYVGRRKADNPFQAAGIAVEETRGLATKTLDAFVHLASTGDTDGVSGPVEIVKVGAEVATEDGATALLQFAAIISVNLAVINSLPVPGLDGGQMVFVLAELLTRRKLERGVAETINGVALLVLLAISLSTFAGDLGVGALFQRILGGAIR